MFYDFKAHYGVESVFSQSKLTPLTYVSNEVGRRDQIYRGDAVS